MGAEREDCRSTCVSLASRLGEADDRRGIVPFLRAHFSFFFLLLSKSIGVPFLRKIKITRKIQKNHIAKYRNANKVYKVGRKCFQIFVCIHFLRIVVCQFAQFIKKLNFGIRSHFVEKH